MFSFIQFHHPDGKKKYFSFSSGEKKMGENLDGAPYPQKS